MKLSYLWKGLPGHPLHPPLTDATIGSYTAATVMAIASVVGVANHAAAHGWWLTIEWGSNLWGTATWHMLSMLTATVFFLIAVLVGHSGYTHAAVHAGPFILTLLGFGFLTLGGWLGGAVVFVHGMRVLNLTSEPPGRAGGPAPHPGKETAEG